MFGSRGGAPCMASFYALELAHAKKMLRRRYWSWRNRGLRGTLNFGWCWIVKWERILYINTQNSQIWKGIWFPSHHHLRCLYLYFWGVYDSRLFIWVSYWGDVSIQELPQLCRHHFLNHEIAIPLPHRISWFMYGGPRPVINGRITPYKWPKING